MNAKEIFKDDLPYAYVHVEEWTQGGFGHINVRFRNLHDRSKYWFRPEGEFLITCQIGGESHKDDPKPYCLKFGYSVSYGAMELPEMEWATKLLKRVNAKLEKMETDYGRPTTYAQFAQRIIKAVGIKWIMKHANHRACLDEREVVEVGVDSTEYLQQVEAALIARHSQKVA